MSNDEIIDTQAIAIGWGIAAVAFSIFAIRTNTSPMVLFAGLFAKTLAAVAGGFLGFTGAILGDVVRQIVRPDISFTSGGFGPIVATRLFWLFGPQVIGLLIGAFIGIGLVLS